MNIKNNGKEKIKSKKKKKKNEDKKTNNLNLNEESPKIKQIKSFDNEINEINEINQDKENSIIINDFLNRVMKTAYERYKEKMSLKKIHSQNDLLSLKFN
jgi:superfamily I DNA/RNA helicase